MSRTANLKVWAAALLAAVAATAMVVALGFTSPAQAANAGDLDASFHGDGKVVFDVFGGVGDSAQAVAIQPDGKIVLAGGWCGFAAQCNTATFAIARFNPDGSLDSAFGSNGRTLVAFPNGSAGARDVAIQGDGKIVAAGWRNDDDGVGDGDFALVRLEPDGDLDPSFSGDGKVMTTFGGDDYGSAVAIQADGRIVAGGSAESEDGDYDFAIARYHAITDNTPPNTTITSGPSGATNSTSATLAFVSSEPGSKGQCSLDGAPFSACSSPKSYSNLIDGSHLFRVRAIDTAGNMDQSPAQRSFTVDTKAPKVNSVLPEENAAGVTPGVNVRATFSEGMSASSINTNTVELFRAGTTTAIGGVVSYDTRTKTVTLNPDIDLRLGTKYKAVVASGTRDLAGNRLDQDQDPTNANQPKVWTFTTGGS